MERKPYEPLEMEIIRFDEEDVLTASGEPVPALSDIRWSNANLLLLPFDP